VPRRLIRFYPAVDAAITRNPGWSNTRRIDIARHAGGVVSQGHGGTDDDEHICDHTPAGKTLTQRGESPFKFGPAKQDTLSLAHAASRSLADRLTPCLRKAAGAQTSASARWISSFRWEPRPPQDSHFGPIRWSEVVPRRKMLRQRREKRVPSLVTDRGRLISQQRGLNVVWLPPALFHEFPHEHPQARLGSAVGAVPAAIPVVVVPVDREHCRMLVGGPGMTPRCGGAGYAAGRWQGKPKLR
jgi:hypothetical protein